MHVHVDVALSQGVEVAGFLICAGQVRRCVDFLVRGDDGKDLRHRLAVCFGDDPPVIGGLAAGEGHVGASRDVVPSMMACVVSTVTP